MIPKCDECISLVMCKLQVLEYLDSYSFFHWGVVIVDKDIYHRLIFQAVVTKLFQRCEYMREQVLHNYNNCSIKPASNILERQTVYNKLVNQLIPLLGLLTYEQYKERRLKLNYKNIQVKKRGYNHKC